LGEKKREKRKQDSFVFYLNFSFLLLKKYTQPFNLINNINHYYFVSFFEITIIKYNTKYTKDNKKAIPFNIHFSSFFSLRTYFTYIKFILHN